MKISLHIIQSVVLLTFCFSAEAEIVKLKNGSVVNGKVVSRGSDELKLDSGIGINVTYYNDDIESIDGESLALNVSDHSSEEPIILKSDQGGRKPTKEKIVITNTEVLADSVGNEELEDSEPDEGEDLIPAEFEPVVINTDEELIRKSIDWWLKKEDFQALEKVYQSMYGRREVFSSGRWRNVVFYNALRESFDERGSEVKLKYIEVLKRWGKQFPNSPAQMIALAEAYKDLAWEYRGGGFARTITDEGGKKFSENLQKSMLVAEDVIKLDPKDPYIFTVMLDDGKGLGMSKEDFSGILEMSRSLEPLFFPTYQTMAVILLPRWYGDPGELEEYAEWIANRTEPYGDEIYARIAYRILNYIGEDFFIVHKFDWERVKRGFNKLIFEYPNSYFLLHRYC